MTAEHAEHRVLRHDNVDDTHEPEPEPAHQHAAPRADAGNRLGRTQGDAAGQGCSKLEGMLATVSSKVGST